MTKRPIFLTYLLLSLVSVSTVFAQNAEIIENWIHNGGESNIKSRHIFVYLPESDFSVENFRNVFDRYSARYCDPYILEIYLFTDRAAIEKQIRWEKNPGGVYIDFSDTPEGRKASQEYYSKVLPAQTGFLRAEYTRYGDYELIAYTKTKQDVADTRIIIQYPGVALTEPRPCSRDKK